MSSPKNKATLGPYSIPMLLRSSLSANDMVLWDGSQWTLVQKSTVGGVTVDLYSNRPATGSDGDLFLASDKNALFIYNA